MERKNTYHHMKIERYLIGGLVALGCSAAACLAQPRFDIEFPASDLPDANQSWATDINESGLVIGSYRADDWKRMKGFAWKDDAIVDAILPQPYDPGSQLITVNDVHRYARATCVNDNGIVAGNTYHHNFGAFETGYFTPIPSPTEFPKLYQSSLETIFGWWTEDLTSTDPMLIVGRGYRFAGLTDYEFSGFVSEVSSTDGPMTGGVTLLPGLGAPHHQSSATAANDTWTVVGWAENLKGFKRAFRWQYGDDSIEDLGTLGGPSSAANDINESGTIVGRSDVGKGAHHAFVIKDNRMQDLGTLGGPSSEALAVNDRNVVVGWSWTNRGGMHATIWHKGRAVDLNTLVDSSDFVLQKAVAINNKGEIAGWGRRHGGNMEAFVLKPR